MYSLPKERSGQVTLWSMEGIATAILESAVPHQGINFNR